MANRTRHQTRLRGVAHRERTGVDSTNDAAGK
jgi:hypothetical protein